MHNGIGKGLNRNKSPYKSSSRMQYFRLCTLPDVSHVTTPSLPPSQSPDLSPEPEVDCHVLSPDRRTGRTASTGQSPS